MKQNVNYGLPCIKHKVNIYFILCTKLKFSDPQCNKHSKQILIKFNLQCYCALW